MHDSQPNSGWGFCTRRERSFGDRSGRTVCSRVAAFEVPTVETLCLDVAASARCVVWGGERTSRAVLVIIRSALSHIGWAGLEGGRKGGGLRGGGGGEEVNSCAVAAGTLIASAQVSQPRLQVSQIYG